MAQSSHELVTWGKYMDHCIGGGDYADEAKDGNVILVAITEDEKPKYAMEITPDGEIQELQGKSGSVPPASVLKLVVEELKKLEILNESQTHKDWTAA